MRKIVTTVAMIAAMSGMAMATEAPQGAGAPAKEKMICKKSADTGSLIQKRRECRTKADWDRIAEAARQGSQSIIDTGAGRPSLGN